MIGLMLLMYRYQQIERTGNLWCEKMNYVEAGSTWNSRKLVHDFDENSNFCKNDDF